MPCPVCIQEEMECLCPQSTETSTGSFRGKEAELRHSPSGVLHWNHSQVQGKLLVPYSMAAQSNSGMGVLVALSAQVGTQNVEVGPGVFQMTEGSMTVLYRCPPAYSSYLFSLCYW